VQASLLQSPKRNKPSSPAGLSTPVAGLYAKRIAFRPNPVRMPRVHLTFTYSGNGTLAYEIKEIATKL
jgi:tRNA (Thr-GGU) A37 N-methylase